ncbi:MAG: ribonuclease HI [Candidatus Zambryskibacteria bacterium]|nr:ribonuclease HI [Candidatus Zambryskibacteria bacterium]
MNTVIFTDGSARGNPGPGGWGAVIIEEDSVMEVGGREEHTTNNRMELTAVISVLESIPNEREMTIYTDSAYVVSGITRWVIGWKKNKWKTSQKEKVLNKDLWEKLVEATTHKVIDWKLIKGHSGTAGNERCDVIATSFADKVPIVLYNGSRNRYGIDVSIKEAKSSKKSKPKRKAYSYISMVDGEIKVHKTWEECKARVHGVSSAKYKKSTSPADEEEIIKEFAE